MVEIDPNVDILSRLRDGNARYVMKGAKPTRPRVRPDEIEQATPVAFVLMCSDMHSPAEPVLGLAPGELIVAQTAAHIVGDDAAAGVMLANRGHGVRLAVVLGHSPCNVAKVCRTGDTPEFHGISGEIQASLATLATNGGRHWIADSTLARSHALRMAEALRTKLRGETEVAVVAAYLDEQTGVVEFLPG